MNEATLERLRASKAEAVLTVEFRVFGLSIRTLRAAAGSWLSGGVLVEGRVPQGGFGPITFGAPVGATGLAVVKTKVRVNDFGGELRRLSETYDLAGSPARIDVASPVLLPSDWAPLFVGIVEDLVFDGLGGACDLMLTVDLGPMQVRGPRPTFTRAECSTAQDQTIVGTPMSVVMGVHDSFKITGRGMLPATNIRWDEDLGYWWHASVGNLRSIPRIYYDGQPRDAGFTVLRGTYGATHQTIIVVDPAYLPEEGALVSFDAEGPDASGGIAGSAITNPIAILRAWLNNYVFRDNRTGAWAATDHDRMESAAWDTAEDWFETFARADGAFRVGGEGEREEPSMVLQRFMEAHSPFVRFAWTESGRLSVMVIDCEDVDPGARIAIDQAESLKIVPGDRKGIRTGRVQPYLYSAAEQKFLATLEAHDIRWTPEEEWLPEETENEFSQGRYDLP